MSAVIRTAVPADAPVLARLRWAFRAAETQPVEDEEAFVARCTAWMAERLATSRWRCWVADAGDEIDGCLWLQLVEKVPNPAAELEQHAYITSVYVRPAARGSGTGEALLRVALDFCRENGVDSAILWPTARSRSLYARHGFSRPDDMLEALIDDSRHLDLNMEATEDTESV
jgi:ribosomal protein S18 acetylase RimI-like enzyme